MMILAERLERLGDESGEAETYVGDPFSIQLERTVPTSGFFPIKRP